MTAWEEQVRKDEQILKQQGSRAVQADAWDVPPPRNKKVVTTVPMAAAASAKPKRRNDDDDNGDDDDDENNNGGDDGNAHGADRVNNNPPDLRTNAEKSKARIPGHDFRAWDKYDVDKALDEVDSNASKSNKSSSSSTTTKAATAAAASNLPVNTSTNWSTADSGSSSRLPSRSVDVIPSDPVQRATLAAAEKEKGNESFRAGDLEEALVYYSRSLRCVLFLLHNSCAGLFFTSFYIFLFCDLFWYHNSLPPK